MNHKEFSSRGGKAGRGTAKVRITAKYAAINRWHGEAVGNAAAEIAVEITRELGLNGAAVGGLAVRFREIIMRNLSAANAQVQRADQKHNTNL